MSEPQIERLTSGASMALRRVLSSVVSFLFMCLYSCSITVLGWAGMLAEFALWSRMTYLTVAWELDTTHAAAIVNGCNGVQRLMPTGMAFLADAFVSDYRMLLFSTLAYSLGMGFFAMSTLALLSKYGGLLSCDNSPAKCITDAQKALFYISLPFIIIGVSGHVAFFGPIETESDQRKKSWTFMSFFWKFIRLLVPLIIAFALSFLPWFGQYGIPAIVLVLSLVATLLFMSGSDSYIHAAEPQGSSLTTVSRVFVASASKMFCRLSVLDANQLHENRHSSECLPHTQGLRCLDKAAIVVPTQIENLEQQEQNRWKLCSVTEVEETKIFIRMIPLWMTFIMCGLVSSVGDTFFLDQAANLDQNSLSFLLLIFQKIAELVFSTVTKKLIENGSRKSAAPVGNIVAMIFSILCCMTAALVETRRLDVIKSHGLTEKPDEEIPMSMFWLIPQFLLLGALDGISHKILVDRDKISGFSIACFFNGEVPDSISSYLKIFSDSAFGIGIWGGVVLVYIVGKVKPSWFQKTLNKSRLDNYYWTLTVLSFITFVFSILVAIWYNYQHSAIEEIRTTESQSSAQT